MLTTHSHARSGATLAELLVALTLSAIVLGAGTSSLLRQQQTASALGGSASGEAQRRAATGALAAELSVLTQGSGDLAPGEARDTSLELRGFIVGGTACDDAEGAATFADDDDPPASVPSVEVPKVGDSLWWYAGASGWRGRRITASDSVSALCTLTSAPIRSARRVTIAERDTIPAGAPLRVTRPVRYDFYKSGDGTWQLGRRDWQEATRRFAPPQPVAGPFVYRAGAERTSLRYFNADGLPLTVGPAGASADAVVRVRISVVAVDRWARGARDSLHRDSVDVVLQRARRP